MQVNELIAVGGVIVAVAGGFVGIKAGLNGTKKLVKETNGNVKELLLKTYNHEVEIATIKQHCIDMHGEK